MKPDHWQKVEQLSHAVLECEENQRAMFIKESKAGDEKLRQHLESLLGYGKHTDSFFKHVAGRSIICKTRPFTWQTC